MTTKKKLLLSSGRPKNIIFDNNYRLYDQVGMLHQDTSGRPYKSNNDLKILSKEETIYDDDYRLDGPGVGVRSTQQINIDYEVFENHVFFDSAVSKINVAFDKIVNEFPLEASESDLFEFKQNLTGYERYILKKFAKNIGYLNFSGSAVGEHSGKGQYIEIKDSAGALFPNFSTRNDLAPVLSPGNSPFTIEFFVKVPNIVNDNQSIFQLKQSKTNAIAVSLSASLDTNKCKAVFDVVSGSTHTFVSASLNKGVFNHVACVYSFNKSTDSGRVKIYVDGTLKNTSLFTAEIQNFRLNFQNSSAFIGSGSNISTRQSENNAQKIFGFTPKQTFSGSIDEFRFYHLEKSEKQITDNMFKTVYGGPESRLAAYFRFNEPFGNYSLPHICLDASSNSLHSKIINFTQEIRNTGSIGPSPVKQEIIDDHPVLYPEFPSNRSLHSRLMASASLYDEKNPNLITNLVPVHYLLDGNDFEGLVHFTGSYGNVYKSQNIPNSGKIGSGQLLMSFLFLWAKYFDELKIYIDTLSRVLNYGYDLDDVAIEKFLPFIGNYYGIDLPGIFTKAGQRQYNTKAGINNLGTVSTYSLYDVQNKIWRQILANLNVLRQGKGTISSVKGIIRTLGVEPDTIFDVREYGGPKAFYLDGRRKSIKKNYQMIDFSGSLASTSGILNAQGFSSSKPHIVGSFLSGSRVEVGFPEPNTTRATGLINFTDNDKAKYNNDTIKIIDANSKEVTYKFRHSPSADPTGTIDTSASVYTVIVNLSARVNGTDYADELRKAIESLNGHAGSITAVVNLSVAGRLNLTQLPNGNITTTGANSTIVYTNAGGSPPLNVSGFSGGVGMNTEGNSFKHGISQRSSDGLFTSGSFSVEGIFQFPTSRTYPEYQSLIRLNTTGSAGTQNNLLANIVLQKNDTTFNSFDDTATLYFYNNSNSKNGESAALHTLQINSASIFNGRPWYINFGFIRGDDPYSQQKTQISSSFFLHCMSDDEFFATSSLANKEYYGESTNTNNVYSNVDVNRNSLGPFITMGSQSIATTENRFLNNPIYNSTVRSSNFAGKVNFLRFWSKGTTLEEARERGRSLRSLGVEHPKSQYNHMQELTGAFNRLRVDAKIGIQAVTSSNNLGRLTVSDFSQNNLHFTGKGFETNKLILKNELFMFSSLSPKFDIRSTEEKVRVRSFIEKENIESDPFAKAVPIFNLDDEFPPEDDNRFSIDLSVVKALDEDIMKMFSSLQSFDDALGDTRDIFEDSYIDLENLRKAYFEDLTEKLNLSSYSQFFTWFDEAFTQLIGGFIPLRVNFLGVNHVIESHVLERHKARYYYDDQYLMNRKSIRENFGNK